MCIHCNDNQVEIEEHFLLKCPKFLNERVIMYQNISEATMNLDIPKPIHSTNDQPRKKLLQML